MRRAAPFLALAAMLVAGCDREERRLFTAPDGRDRLVAPAPIDLFRPLHPGDVKPLPDASAFEPYGNNAKAISDGQLLFTRMNCAGCHSSGGGGGMGPALMDDEWRYGGDPRAVFETITLGRPRGMPTFGRYLNEDQTWKLVAYVRTLSGLARADAQSGRADHVQNVEEKRK
jgi:cytochrome c oxidase cbb3-type subunit III